MLISFLLHYGLCAMQHLVNFNSTNATPTPPIDTSGTNTNLSITCMI